MLPRRRGQAPAQGQLRRWLTHRRQDYRSVFLRLPLLFYLALTLAIFLQSAVLGGGASRLTSRRRKVTWQSKPVPVWRTWRLWAARQRWRRRMRLQAQSHRGTQG